MRILLVGDYAETGFGQITSALAGEWSTRHDVDILGVGYCGDSIDTRGANYNVWSALSSKLPSDAFGVARLPFLMRDLAPDVVVILQDPWNIPAYIKTVTNASAHAAEIGSIPIVGYLAVDGENQNPADLTGLAAAVFWTDFGARQFRDAPVCPLYVSPLGLASAEFDLDSETRKATRRTMFPGLDDVFVVGSVGRNQERKRFDILLEAFKLFLGRAEDKDAILYLHALDTATGAHFDIASLVRYYGLRGRVFGLENPTVTSASRADMAKIFSTFDLYATAAAGEGWGFPVAEALASGVPVVVPDNSAFGAEGWLPKHELVYRVPCRTVSVLSPVNVPDGRYVIGRVPTSDDMAEQMWRAFTTRHGATVPALRSWKACAEEMTEILEQVVCG